MSKKKRTPRRLTKRERKELEGRGPSMTPDAHIHCVACGAHIDGAQFTATPSSARWIRCRHGSRFACCVECVGEAQRRLDEHDRSGKPVQTASAWH
jgi:hypothetical protein